MAHGGSNAPTYLALDSVYHFALCVCIIDYCSTMGNLFVIKATFASKISFKLEKFILVTLGNHPITICFRICN